jgi:hypothetical protein
MPKGSNRWGNSRNSEEDNGAIQLRRQPFARFRWEIKLWLRSVFEAWSDASGNKLQSLWFIIIDLGSQLKDILLTSWGRALWTAFWLWILWLSWR